jgi:hypothetical protein
MNNELTIGVVLTALITATVASAADTGVPNGVSFEGAVDYSAGNSPASLAVGDFNRDAAPDLVLANQDSGYVSVLLGNGDGTFQAAQNVDVLEAHNTFCVAVTDFYGRGILDLFVGVYSCYDCGSSKLRGVPSGGEFIGVELLRGRGDGTFQDICGVGGTGIPVSVAVGDFNGDGVPDVATVNYDFGIGAVLLGRRAGVCLQYPHIFRAGRGPRSVAVGDFNGDGIQDLAVANQLSNDVSVLLGNGDGTFQAPQNFAAGDGPSSVAIGDFNDDGIQDLAIANQLSNDLSVLLGNGDGTFQDAVNFDAGDGPSSVAVGKFRGVGMPDDLAVANAASDNVSVLLGNGDGTFQAAVNFDAGDGPSSIAVSDFNGDELPDLAVANIQSNSVSVLINNTPRG